MLILSVTIAFLLLGVLWLAAVLHEHGLTPMRRMAELMKRPAAEIALVALVAVGLIHHGATKTNVNCKMENVKLGDAPMIVPDSTETRRIEFRVAAGEDGAKSASVVCDGATKFGEALGGDLRWLYDRGWNMARVTRRGVDSPGEIVLVASDHGGMKFIMR
jgi:hypothetical protein